MGKNQWTQRAKNNSASNPPVFGFHSDKTFETVSPGEYAIATISQSKTPTTRAKEQNAEILRNVLLDLVTAYP
jgi:hypothetical protein